MFTRSQTLNLVVLVLMVALAGAVQYLTDHHIYVPPIVVAVAGLAATAITGLCRSLIGSLAGQPTGSLANSNFSSNTLLSGNTLDVGALANVLIPGLMAHLLPQLKAHTAPATVNLNVARELSAQELAPALAGQPVSQNPALSPVAVEASLPPVMEAAPVVPVAAEAAPVVQ